MQGLLEQHGQQPGIGAEGLISLYKSQIDIHTRVCHQLCIFYTAIGDDNIGPRKRSRVVEQALQRHTHSIVAAT